MNDSLKMGLRSLGYRRKQYTSLFLVAMFGVGISLFCLFLVDGMLSALQNKARIYYGGDYQFMGGESNQDIKDYDAIIEELKTVFPEGTVIAPRFNYFEEYGAFYYEGTGVRQRMIKGVDFNVEKALFNDMNYVAGSSEGLAGTDGVLLSKPIAEMLEVQIGDQVTMMLRARNGSINTVYLTVRGIFSDSSLFGMYTSYLDISVLRNTYLMPETSCNRICITLPEGMDGEKEAAHFQSLLEEKFNMYPLVEDKQIFYAHRGELGYPNFALLTINSNLEEVKILIDAMKLLSSFVIIVLIVIIVAGISSTFRVIVMKRINEIGIYKAIGMRYGKIMGMLLTETGLLTVTGCIAGFLFSLVLCKLAGLFNLSFIPAFDIFLTDSVLVPQVDVLYFLMISAIITVTTMVAVFFRVCRSVAITPCEALAVTE